MAISLFRGEESKRSFFVAQLQADTLNDHFAYMGSTREGNKAKDGMVVFGFGRDRGARPLMTDTGSFIIGFLDRKISSEKDHRWAIRQIQIWLLNKQSYQEGK